MGIQVETVSKHIEEHLCVCRRCSGTGRLDNGAVCSQCQGTGRVFISSDVTTYIRPFVPEE